jgi:hypothetical protein
MRVWRMPYLSSPGSLRRLGAAAGTAGGGRLLGTNRVLRSPAAAQQEVHRVGRLVLQSNRHFIGLTVWSAQPVMTAAGHTGT